MAKFRAADAAKLRDAKPLCSRAEFEDIVEKLEPAMRRLHAAATYALCSGPQTILSLHTDDPGAVAAARALEPARQAAQLLRRLASIAEAGAARAECAIRMRADHKLIFEEAARDQ